MKQSDIEQAVIDYSRAFADPRTNLFDVQPVIDGNRLRLRGRVLEAHQRQGLLDELAHRFLPGLEIDASEVVVLRDAAQPRWVSTNLTSMHQGTSFLAELSTQMLNGAPLEVLWEEGRWGFARLADGYMGWTYLPYLTAQPAPQPTHIVTAPLGLLHESPDAGSGLLTRVLGGTFVHQAQVDGSWACLELAGGMRGWMSAESLTSLDGLLVSAPARRASIVEHAFRLTGVPYLWGGSSANGIDCSGFAQLLHRLVGITLPRDADMQFDAGKPVEPPFEPGDLIFFGESGEKRRITHVGMSLGGWRMIHSSRARNGVQVDDVQETPHLRDSYLCAATYIGK